MLSVLVDSYFGMTLFLGRFFCGWLCPFALIMDIESLLRRALKIRHRIIPDKLNIMPSQIKIRYIIVFLLTTMQYCGF